MDEIDRQLYRIAYQQGQADMRCRCDVCPQRYQETLSALIPAQDVLRRPGIEN